MRVPRLQGAARTNICEGVCDVVLVPVPVLARLERSQVPNSVGALLIVSGVARHLLIIRLQPFAQTGVYILVEICKGDLLAVTYDMLCGYRAAGCDRGCETR